MAAVTLGLDWHARPALQEYLGHLAESSNIGTPQGRARVLWESARTLERAATSWLYIGFQNQAHPDRKSAEAGFRSLCKELRNRYQPPSGTQNPGAPDDADSTARPGVVAVTLVAASHTSLPVGGATASVESIQSVLETFASLTAHDIFAVQVFWVPELSLAQLTFAELEASYPELTKLEASSVPGRLLCQVCRGPFSKELTACPHCETPAPPPPPS